MTSTSSSSSTPESSPCPRRLEHRCRRGKRSSPPSSSSASFAISTSLLTILASFTTGAAAVSPPTPSREFSNLYRGHRQLLFPSPRHVALPSEEKHHLRQRRRTNEEEKEDTNDDAFIIIDIEPFELRLSNVPSASPVAITKSATGDILDGAASNGAVKSILEHIATIGTRTFQSSSVYGERFEELDLGGDWSSDFHRNSRGLLGPADTRAIGLGVPYGGRSLADLPAGAGTTTKGTTTLSLGNGGTVTFNGRHWADDPASSEELTDFMVTELNSDANRDELLMKLRPVVCTPAEMIGNECDLELELLVSSSDAVIAGAGEMVQETPVAPAAEEGGATGVTEPQEVVDNGEQATPAGSSSNGEAGEGATADQTTNPAGAVTAIGTGSSANEIEPQNADGGSNNLKVIIPVAVGLSLVALSLAGLLYLRFKRKKEGREADIKANETAESEDETAPDLHLLPPAIWADSAYDDITSPGEAKTATADKPDSTVFGILKNGETTHAKQ